MSDEVVLSMPARSNRWERRFASESGSRRNSGSENEICMKRKLSRIEFQWGTFVWILLVSLLSSRFRRWIFCSCCQFSWRRRSPTRNLRNGHGRLQARIGRKLTVERTFISKTSAAAAAAATSSPEGSEFRLLIMTEGDGWAMSRAQSSVKIVSSA